jgi:hypothetical protein
MGEALIIPRGISGDIDSKGQGAMIATGLLQMFQRTENYIITHKTILIRS